MPNGFVGSDDEWRSMEAPLQSIDLRLDEFAFRNGMNVTHNYHNWPERSLEWGDDIRRLIQIYMADDEGRHWNLWLCASQDREDGRYWKKTFLRHSISMDELSQGLEELLETARSTVSGWREADLERATD